MGLKNLPHLHRKQNLVNKTQIQGQIAVLQTQTISGGDSLLIPFKKRSK